MPRRTLFVRIFLWFVAALALLFVLGMLVAYLTHEDFSRSSARGDMEEAFSSVEQPALEMLAAQGPSDAMSYLRKEGHKHRMFLLLLPLEGDLTNFTPGPPSFPLARIRSIALTLEPGTSEFSFNRPFSLLLKRVEIRGEAWVLVGARMMPPLIPFHSENPWRSIFQIILILLVGAGACYWLARHITQPVQGLQHTVSGLAEGDLGQRVSEAITARRDELGDLARNVNVMAARLEEMVASQHRLIRDISHELRSPLTRLGLALELSEMKDSPIDKGVLFERMERETHRIRSMVNQLLDLSYMETAKRQVNEEVIDLPSLLSDIRNDVLIEAEHSHCGIILATPDAAIMNGRMDLLRSAFENVIRNAIAYTEPGSDVTVTLKLVGEQFALTVTDMGSGVPEADLHHLFDPFYRVDSARARETGGVGLGLAITERAIRLHGGTITATNRQGGGLCITILLSVPGK
ncbi:MAG: ATP-binding protein [Thermovirgaceae bacterium]|nr:ATP-binding protein [Thermovirgaceae bacterium]